MAYIVRIIGSILIAAALGGCANAAPQPSGIKFDIGAARKKAQEYFEELKQNVSPKAKECLEGISIYVVPHYLNISGRDTKFVEPDSIQVKEMYLMFQNPYEIRRDVFHEGIHALDIKCRLIDRVKFLAVYNRMDERLTPIKAETERIISSDYVGKQDPSTFLQERIALVADNLVFGKRFDLTTRYLAPREIEEAYSPVFEKRCFSQDKNVNVKCPYSRQKR